MLDFTATMPGADPVSVRAKYMHNPQCFCYARGHLRALRVTGWTEEGSEEKKAHSINTPFPFHPAGGKAVFAELWLHTGEKSVNPACKASGSGMDEWDPIEVDNLGKDDKGEVTGDTLVVLAELIDPHGEVRCTQKLEVPWSKKDGVREGEERAAFLTMACGPLEPGVWHLHLQKEGVARPFVYRVPMLFLPLGEELDRAGPQPTLEEADFLQGVWTIDTVAKLPLEDLYHDQSRLLKHFRPKAGHKRDKRSIREPSILAGNFSDWLVCSGGLVSCVLVLLFSYNCLYLPLAHPSRYHLRALYPTLGLSLTACLAQSLLCSLYC